MSIAEQSSISTRKKPIHAFGIEKRAHAHAHTHNKLKRKLLFFLLAECFCCSLWNADFLPLRFLLSVMNPNATRSSDEAKNCAQRACVCEWEREKTQQIAIEKPNAQKRTTIIWMGFHSFDCRRQQRQWRTFDYAHRALLGVSSVANGIKLNWMKFIHCIASNCFDKSRDTGAHRFRRECACMWHTLRHTEK